MLLHSMQSCTGPSTLDSGPVEVPVLPVGFSAQAVVQPPLRQLFLGCVLACTLEVPAGVIGPAGVATLALATGGGELGAADTLAQSGFFVFCHGMAHAAEDSATASRMAIASAAKPAKALPHPSCDEVTGTKPSHLA